MKPNFKPVCVWGIGMIILFSGCKKTNQFKSKNEETKVNLVALSVAREIAVKFNPNVYYDVSNRTNRKKDKSMLSGNNHIISQETINDRAGIPALYIFNFEEGYMAVSGEYQMDPIMAFVPKGKFIRNKLPCGPQLWLENTINNVEMLRKGLYDNSKLVSKSWEMVLSSEVQIKEAFPKTIKINADDPPGGSNPCEDDPDYTGMSEYTNGPLLTTSWDQGCTYNDLLPAIGCGGATCWRPLTGCVATAMAQVIAYWQFPTGSYNYASMPSSMGDANVQALMRDAGTSVNMNYGCTGSGATTSDAATALTTTFGYSSASWNSYNKLSDYSIVWNEIANSRPVIFKGNSASLGGHAWVCDGAKQTFIYACSDGTLLTSYTYHFNMNWGWGGAHNGWYIYNNWALPALSTDFNNSNGVISNIHP